ncbi:uncharacterized protein LOC108229602 [Kryptolebias marmoratus]|uniref:uncharacterized protein LOC108229602 n=1 Tax=Kryptolebias marmoratus TaxID=37003 RepID=UPI0007F8CE15|nr:uncharacterized protein LOC108229602 [Kryptolebias marmoratus]
MLRCLCFLLAGSFCRSSDVREQTALLHSVASFPCPHAAAGVTWSRFRNGQQVTLIRVTGDQEIRSDKRFGSLADGALVIWKVELSDESLYFCNQKKTVYLRVTTDPNTVFQTGSGPRSTSDQQDPESSDSWRIPVGVTTGAALMLLSIFILRVCSARRAEQRNRKRTGTEVVYEEIQNTGVELESPYYSTVTFTPAELYSAVNKPAVYFLIQNPQGGEPSSQSPGSV